ncbi:Vacuolar segregation protein PEP7 [Smittium culicis]|uniref:Vacuolar segregation protein PEP7 n=1 Tax=Smittium culicis TaxID=133412 RepID=A0A1R1XQB2_9FUNG|nr:Vacuolar segregation protein PEP7 [Smittium culicis]
MESRKRRVFGAVQIDNKDENTISNPILEVNSSETSISEAPTISNPEIPLNQVQSAERITSSSQSIDTSDNAFRDDAADSNAQTCPICNNFSGTLAQINRHLDSFHFNNNKDNLNIQDSAAVDEIKDTVFGFLRSAGQKVRGLGNTITKGKLDSELERLGILEIDTNSGHTLSNDFVHPEEDFPAQSSEIPYNQTPINSVKTCNYESCNTTEDSQLPLKTCKFLIGGSSNSPIKFDPLNNSLATLEKSIVAWESDSFAKKCHICLTTFGSIKRKHHCRLCGKIVCGKPSCFLRVEMPFEKNYIPEHKKQNCFTLKTCPVCLKSLRLIQDKNEPVESSILLQMYDQMSYFRKKVDTGLENIKQLLLKIESSNNTQIKSRLLIQSNQLRKELLQQLGNFDTASKIAKKNPEINSLDKSSENRVSLTSLILSNNAKHLPSDGNLKDVAAKDNPSLLNNLESMPLFTNESNSNKESGPPPPLPSRKSDLSSVNTLETRPIFEVDLIDESENLQHQLQEFDKINANLSREELISKLGVLREQRVLVQSYIKELNSKREWETVLSLHENFNDLENEISSIEKML